MGITAEWLIERANKHLADCPYGGARAVLTNAEKAMLRAVADYLDDVSRTRGEDVRAIKSQLFALQNGGDAA